MYASIRKYSVIPGRVNEWMRRVQRGFVPLISNISGFVAYYALEVKDDEAITVSIFDTQAGAEESAWQAADWVTKNLASLNRGLAEITLAQVRISHVGRLAEEIVQGQNPAMPPVASVQPHLSDDDHGPYSSSTSTGTQM